MWLLCDVTDVMGSKHQQTAGPDSGTHITNNTFYKVALLHSPKLGLRKVYTADSVVGLSCFEIEEYSLCFASQTD